MNATDHYPMAAPYFGKHTKGDMFLNTYKEFESDFWRKATPEELISHFGNNQIEKAQ